MKPIIFTRENYRQIKNLKYVYTCISIKVFNLCRVHRHESIHTLSSELSAKLQSFIDKYDDLCTKMSQTSCEIEYFTDDLAILGHNCLVEIDAIGDFLDASFDQFTPLFKQQFSRWIDSKY